MELLVSDLMCARGGVPVLSGVTFRVAMGEAVCLRGPNGSGKTTLLRTLAGLQPRIAGSASLVPEEMAYAGHADGLKATLTVAENLAFWAAVYGTRGIGDALDRFRLTRLARRPAQNLSAGQKRRLGLARLLVTGRPVWLLDEPTVSLDRDGVALFAEAMAAHLAGGGSAVIATHIDLGFAARDLDVVEFKAPSRGTGAFDEAVG